MCFCALGTLLLLLVLYFEICSSKQKSIPYEFLMRVGLLALMWVHSLIGPAKLCPTLPTMLKSSDVMLWSVFDLCLNRVKMLLDGLLNISPPKVLVDSPMFSSSQVNLRHLYQCRTPHTHISAICTKKEYCGGHFQFHKCLGQLFYTNHSFVIVPVFLVLLCSIDRC